MKVGRVTVNFNSFEGSDIGNGIRDALADPGLSGQYLRDIVGDLPRSIRGIELIEDTSIRTWQSNMGIRNVNIKINPDSSINSYSPGSIFYHEIAHKVGYIHDTAEIRANEYISNNPSAFADLVAAAGSETLARRAVHYGFEENIIQNWTNGYRQAAGEELRKTVTAPTEAMKAYLEYNGQATPAQLSAIDLPEPIFDQTAFDPAFADCFGPDTPIDMWPLDPGFTPDPSNSNKIFDQDAVRAKIWKKPIAMIRKGDIVVSFDKNDNLMPGRVTRTFENESKILLDYFGTRVTPGHVYFRPDSKKADKFECLLDILRDDGMIQNVEGKNIRAAINVPVGDPRDGFVWAITQERKDGILVEKERGRIRLGTRFVVDGKTSQCVADVIEAKDGIVGDDELIRFGNADPAPFVWEHGAALPKPEDFVLQASGTTVADIYKAGEWESRRPHMPAPMVMDGGPVQPLSATVLTAMPRNQPLNLQPAAAPSPKSARRPPMNRRQRRALEAKQRKLPVSQDHATGLKRSDI